MVCQSCGHAVTDEVRFCSKCGAQVSGAPVGGGAGPAAGQAPGFGAPMYATQPPMYGQPPVVMGTAPRVERNVQTLGILWCVYGAYRLLMGLLGMVFLRHFVMGRWGNGRWGNGGYFGGDFGFGPHLFGALLPFVGAITVVASALAVATGISLLMRKPWGRTLAIVAGILALIKPILGTALGVYTLWVMAPSQSGVEYDAISDPS